MEDYYFLIFMSMIHKHTAAKSLVDFSVRSFVLLMVVVGLMWVSHAYAFTLFPPSSAPGIPASTDPNAVELGVRFTSDVDGFATGIRFYKGITNIGPHTGKLWTSTGTLLGSIAFANETASGWQEMAFSSPIAVVANTQYIASYHTASGRYAFDRDYFSVSEVYSVPLRAPAITNGVYQYGAGGFPSSSWNSSNYWVDVVIQVP
jgi:hypothetical protein